MSLPGLSQLDWHRGNLRLFSAKTNQGPAWHIVAAQSTAGSFAPAAGLRSAPGLQPEG